MNEKSDIVEPNTDKPVEGVSENSTGKFMFAQREFDSQEQAETWALSLTKTVGHQGNELGQLKKFKSLFEVTKEQEAVLSKVKELRSEGDMEKADELLFGYVTREKKELIIKAQNDKFWDGYAKSRDKTLGLGEDLMRAYVENNPELVSALEQAPDQGEYLDGLFGKLVKRERLLAESEPLTSSAAVPAIPANKAIRDSASNDQPSKPTSVWASAFAKDSLK